jgi:prepilin-type processing-associated H-X9-DG protein
LIELLVVIAIIGVLIALLLPAVQAAREAARRVQCLNNLKQLALAAANYAETHGALPMGGFWRPGYTFDGMDNAHGFLVCLLPYVEQKTLYDAYNFSMNGNNYCNFTVGAVGVSTFWCPSDGSVSGGAALAASSVYLDAPASAPTIRIQYSSYGSNVGPWFVYPALGDPDYVAGIQGMQGVIYLQSSIRFADITDGLSATMLLGERAHGLIGPPRQDLWSWMAASIRTSLTTQFPMNPKVRCQDFVLPFGSEDLPPTSYLVAASSFHPGGCNFAFADGSVRFIKDSVDSWPIDGPTGQAVGLSYMGNLVRLAPGTRLGVYQALSTRSGGEVVGAGSY